MKISIIVPVYNTEKYLSRCIDSIINQTYKNIEVLLVDDGSNDNSGLICDNYAKKDKRIKVFHQKNSGQSSARNLALEHVTGDYLGFVDSDDWIDLNTYQYLVELVLKSKADVGFIEREKVYNEDEVKKIKNKKEKVELFEKENILIEYLNYGMKTGNYGLPNYLYKKELFRNIRFPVGRICEDIVTNFKLLNLSKKMIKSNRICYYYFQDNYSTTRNKFSNKDYDLLYACEELKKEAANHSKKIQSMAKEKEARSYFSLICKIDRYGVADNIDERKEIKYLLPQLKKNLNVFLKTSAPFNRKIIAIMICVNNTIVKKLIRKK